MNCSLEDLVRWWRQHEVAGGTYTCLGNNWRHREPHAESIDSGKAEPAALEDPPKTHQTPHHGHTGAERGGRSRSCESTMNACSEFVTPQKHPPRNMDALSRSFTCLDMFEPPVPEDGDRTLFVFFSVGLLELK